MGKFAELKELKETAPVDDAGTMWYEPNQLTINEYSPGQGIGPHMDNHSDFGHTILSLSLCAGTVMYFRQCESGTHKYVVLPRRSLVLLQGESRFGWMHAIYARKTDMIDGKLCYRKLRTSLTFRRVRTPENPCRCAFAKFCDAQHGSIPPSTIMLSRSLEKPDMDAAAAPVANTSRRSYPATHMPAAAMDSKEQHDLSFMEKEHVVKFYDTIASHFSQTRHTPWPQGMLRVCRCASLCLPLSFSPLLTCVRAQLPSSSSRCLPTPHCWMSDVEMVDTWASILS